MFHYLSRKSDLEIAFLWKIKLFLWNEKSMVHEEKEISEKPPLFKIFQNVLYNIIRNQDCQFGIYFYLRNTWKWKKYFQIYSMWDLCWLFKIKILLQKNPIRSRNKNGGQTGKPVKTYRVSSTDRLLVDAIVKLCSSLPLSIKIQGIPFTGLWNDPQTPYQ